MLSQESVQIAAFQEADINPMSAAGFVAAWRRHHYQAVLSPVDSRGKHRVALTSSLPLRHVQLPDLSCADRVAAGVVVWPLSEGPTSVLVVSFYGYSGDAPRTSLAFESLMSAVAIFGGPYVILGDFNITQTEGSLAAMLATGTIRAADDTGGSLHPNTNPTNARRIDFAVTHQNLVASHVHTFRLPAVSDHGIVRVDFPTIPVFLVRGNGPPSRQHLPLLMSRPRLLLPLALSSRPSLMPGTWMRRGLTFLIGPRVSWVSPTPHVPAVPLGFRPPVILLVASLAKMGMNLPL